MYYSMYSQGRWEAGNYDTNSIQNESQYQENVKTKEENFPTFSNDG